MHTVHRFGGGSMNGKKASYLVLCGFVLFALFAAGFLTGYLYSDRNHSRRDGIEFESVRAEQRRVETQYQQLRVNYSRERELNSRIRTVVESSTGILQSNDQSISGLRKQISALREKIQELKDLFDSINTGGGPGRFPDYGAGDEAAVKNSL
jgi:septal ring factor EnvC (AmiA/AmiB activator)